MVLSLQQKEIILQYRDKSYISSILCQESTDWYSLLKTITNIPLILISTTMSILNSLNINNYDMQIPNIVINAVFALVLSLINNFKITEKQANFKSLNIKYIKLTHYIEDKITNELENCTKEDIRQIINDYDIICENLEFSYPGFIKKRIKKRFFGKKTLPNILNCEIIFDNEKVIETPTVKYLINDETPSILIESESSHDIIKKIDNVKSNNILKIENKFLDISNNILPSILRKDTSLDSDDLSPIIKNNILKEYKLFNTSLKDLNIEK
jgi:hypothetical protein